ncbi:MAG: hypothetical protein JKY52_19395, partial [Flavobacteriales bacterium]|nr:hypothetical protein [Flavobacteriales bacterium]
PAAPTAAQGTNTTQLATTAFVEAEAVLTASQVTAVAVAADLVIDTAYKLADTALGVRIDNNTHAQSSGAEITAGTETELRSNSPADIVSYITQHTTPGLGVDQTWQDMMSSRSSGVTYTNSSGRPIMVTCNAYGSGSPANGQVTFLINGDRVSLSGGGAIASGAIGDSPSYIIPNGDTYQATFVGPYIEWWELRA